MDIATIATIGIVSLLGAMSPGPDFAVVTRNCLSGNFRTGFLTTLGIVFALAIHVTYSILGIAFIIAESPSIFYLLKYLGAGYLFYLGIRLLIAKETSDADSKKVDKKEGRKAFISGFFCNLLNPKCTLFILSLFTQFIDPNMGILEKVILGGVILLTTFGWFSFLSFLITHHLLQKHFARFQWIISKIMGIILSLLAVYVAIIS